MRTLWWIPAGLLATGCTAVGAPSGYVGPPGEVGAAAQWRAVQAQVLEVRQGTFTLEIRGVAGSLVATHRGSFDLDVPAVEEESREVDRGRWGEKSVTRSFVGGSYRSVAGREPACWEYRSDGAGGPGLVLTHAIRMGRLVDDPATSALLEIEIQADDALRLLGVENHMVDELNRSVAAAHVPALVQLSGPDTMAWFMVRGSDVMEVLPRGGGLTAAWADYLPHAHSTHRISASTESITIARPETGELCPGHLPPNAEERGAQNITVENRADSTKPTFS